MTLYTRFLIPFLLFFIASSVKAIGPLDSLWEIYHATESDDERQQYLHEIAVFHLDILNDEVVYDSIYRSSISIAEGLFDKELILKSNIGYLKSIPFGSNAIYVNKRIRRVLELSNKMDEAELFEIWLIISRACLKTFNDEEANNYALRAINYSFVIDKPVFQIKALLAMGKGLEAQNKYVSAFQQYMNAKYLLEEIRNTDNVEELKIECYEHLFSFFQKLKNYDEAAEYKNQIIKQVSSFDTIDKTKLHWQFYDLAGLSLSSGRHGMIISQLERILIFSKATGNIKLKQHALSLYRTLLIETQNFKGFDDLYIRRYPDEFAMMKKINFARYNQIKAYIHESNKNIDSAKVYFNIASSHVEKGKNSISKSSFYRRLGEFLLRNNQVDEAYVSFEKSYNYAEKHHYVPYIIESASNLSKLAHQRNNFEEAYLYQEIYYNAVEERNKGARHDKLLKIELNNEAKHLELQQQREEETRKKKFNIQYLIITLGILLLFVLIIVMSRVAVPEWVIKGSGFISILMLFEFIILILDNQIHHLTHGAPLYIFIIKIVLLSVLFPLHHIVEHRVVSHLIERKQIWAPNKKNIAKIFHFIWPWLKKEDK